MDFLKKHYEKVLLGMVLVGLAGGAALLPWMIWSDTEAERQKKEQITSRRIDPLEPLNLTNVTALIHRAATPMSLDFATLNKVFNPVPWQKSPDGTLKKIMHGNELGIGAMVVTKITPLYTTFTLDSVIPSETGARYMIGIVREADAKAGDRGKKTVGASLNEKNKEGFTIREVKGPPDKITEATPELTLELTDTGERASVSKGKPFKRADGYMADLKYPPENRTWSNQRLNATIPRIAGEDYNLVAIATNEVVFSAKSNHKKTSIPFSPGP
jgi:hypothetical protein